MKEAGIPITNGVGASKICSELGMRQGRSGMTSENKNSLTLLVLKFKFSLTIQSLQKILNKYLKRLKYYLYFFLETYILKDKAWRLERGLT